MYNLNAQHIGIRHRYTELIVTFRITHSQ